MLPGADKPSLVARQGRRQDMLGQIERRMGEPEYFDSEEASDDMDWLNEALNEFAPDGHHFSSHEGDGACFGYWYDDAR